MLHRGGQPRKPPLAARKVAVAIRVETPKLPMFLLWRLRGRASAGSACLPQARTHDEAVNDRPQTRMVGTYVP